MSLWVLTQFKWDLERRDQATSDSDQAGRIETFLYDANGDRTEDESRAVRAETVELDAEGRVIATHAHDSLAWKVDPISLKGDAGELATRPEDEPNPR
jgi:YD repeat-containing protein